MKKFRFNNPCLLYLIFILLLACKKKEEIACVAMAVTITTVASDSCVAQGKIIVVSPVGAGVQYRLGTGAYQASPEFSPLVAGAYPLSVKSNNHCETSITLHVPSTMPGPLFTAVKNVLAINCARCHSGVNPQAGHDWTNACAILLQWERIKARAVDGIPTPMPTAGLIPQSERSKITDWINAGHRYTD